MADMRRRSLEPPPQLPQIQFTPGLANEMLPELAPLLAEEASTSTTSTSPTWTPCNRRSTARSNGTT
jgi:hypothetical protein